jgi:hypothetical protein
MTVGTKFRSYVEMPVDDLQRSRNDLRSLHDEMVLKNPWMPNLGNERLRLIEGSRWSR